MTPPEEFCAGQLWLAAEYCGVQVLIYAILSNHFYVLMGVPRRETPSDTELLRRYQLL